ncbi:hypothetical protein CRM22_000840 [Opisthorchis felineus]|uniref:Peptidase S1 domain-containing protein n=1 Tax=Opisthorchis felineus TaxID=147828 RepID=A0A4S2MDJ1_OPIFE|nr:hypothetical protein CRM22_000840 [Opisthorchis felineus]
MTNLATVLLLMITTVKEARSPDIRPPKCSWVVRIEKRWWTGTRELYTGSLIDENWVLTAGSCCPERNKTLYSYKVLLSASCESVGFSNSAIEVKQCISHPDYNRSDKSTWGNDIGLVELVTPLAFPSRALRFVQLPKSEDAGTKVKLGLFMGFKTSYLFEESAKEERNFEMPVFAPIICPAFYWPRRQQRGFCAGGPNQAQFTPGDRGAGLVEVSEKQSTLVGVLSEIMPHRALYIPIFFVRVASHSDWLNETVLGNSPQISS